MNAKKLIRELIRMKLFAGGKPGEYVLNVSPAGVKVALAREYNLAVLAGMEDFWELVPMFDGQCDCLAAFKLNADHGDGECRVTCIFDGHSKTYTLHTVQIVPKHYVCTVATAKEVGNAVDHAKEQAARRNGKRHEVERRFFHDGNYSISRQDAEALKRELFHRGNDHSYLFMTAVLKLIDQASERQERT